MYQLPLLSNQYKRPGMILFLLSLGLGIIAFIKNWEPSFLQYDFSNKNSEGSLSEVFGGSFLFTSQGNFTDEILILGIIIGGCLWGFSKEKEEDEFLNHIRLSSLIWAFLINYLLIMLCTIFIYDFWYLNVMLFNLITPLVIFLIRYNYLLIKIRNVE